MKNITIIGANGKVGVETCLYLRRMGYNVIPIVRSSVGSILLKKLGFKCRIIKIEDDESCKTAISDSDLIVDLSVQSGQINEIEKTIKTQIELILKNCPLHTKFIYASSIMAYGMNDFSNSFKYYFFSRTIYGKWKRTGEKIVSKLGKKYNKKIFIFHFGHVYGYLQPIQNNLLAEFRNGKKIFILPPKTASTIFVCSIAETISQVMTNKLSTGTYTLINYPFWSWSEVYYYIAKKFGYEIKILTADQSSLSTHKLFAQQIKNSLNIYIIKYNELLRAYFLKYFPALEIKLKAKNLISKASKEINEYFSLLNKPDRIEFGGDPKGKLVKILTDPKLLMDNYESSIIEELNSIIEK